MNLKTYIEKIGDAEAAEQFGVSPRTAQSWRLGTRRPSTRAGARIIRETRGLLDWDGIYGATSERRD